MPDGVPIMNALDREPPAFVPYVLDDNDKGYPVYRHHKAYEQQPSDHHSKVATGLFCRFTIIFHMELQNIMNVHVCI